MTVTYRSDVVHVSPTPLGLLPQRWDDSALAAPLSSARRSDSADHPCPKNTGPRSPPTTSPVQPPGDLGHNGASPSDPIVNRSVPENPNASTTTTTDQRRR